MRPGNGEALVNRVIVRESPRSGHDGRMPTLVRTTIGGPQTTGIARRTKDAVAEAAL